MDFDAPVPLEEEEEEQDGGVAAPLMALLRQQQAQLAQANAGLQDRLAQQRQQAHGMRTLGFLSSFGQNPLLQGLRQEAGQQANALESMAARTESRMDAGRGIDPLGIARLQQAAEKMEQDKALAMERLGFQRETAAAKAEAAKLKASAGAVAAEKKKADKVAAALAKMTTDLRKEFEALQPVKDYRLASVAYDKVKFSAEDPSAAGDLALIFGYMKTLDPTSAVRETEFANAENAKGVPEAVRSKWNKFLSGERLTPEQRKEFSKSAATQFKAHERAFEEQALRYAGLAPEGAAEKVIGMPTPKPPTVAPRTTATNAMPTDASGALSLDDVPTPPKARTPKEEQALKWARANRTDPRATAIFAKLGVSE